MHQRRWTACLCQSRKVSISDVQGIGKTTATGQEAPSPSLPRHISDSAALDLETKDGASAAAWSGCRGRRWRTTLRPRSYSPEGYLPHCGWWRPFSPCRQTADRRRKAGSRGAHRGGVNRARRGRFVRGTTRCGARPVRAGTAGARLGMHRSHRSRKAISARHRLFIRTTSACRGKRAGRNQAKNSLHFIG